MASYTQDIMIENSLLVAGPSGGGKSTFINALKNNDLSSEIIMKLPSGCENWPVFEANNMLKDGVKISDVLETIGNSSELIIHYDTTFIHRFGIESYNFDPVDDLLKLIKNLHCVFVRTDANTLILQHQMRLLQQRERKSALSLFWGDKVRLPLRRISAKIKGKPFFDTKELYNNSVFLEKSYNMWESYVDDLHAEDLLTIRPEGMMDGHPKFSLTSVVTH